VYPLASYDAVRPRHGGFVWETEILVRAAAHGIDVVEVPVSVIPRAGRRSRFRPLGDGGAIAAYLVGPVVRRWALELGAGAHELRTIFTPEASGPRHAAIVAALGEVSMPLWGPTMMRVWGAMATQCLAGWWAHPRRKRATAAAVGTLAAPAALALLAARTASDDGGRDVIGRAVRRLYDPGRLAPDRRVRFGADTAQVASRRLAR
jgi:hypothetical protein